MGDAKALSPDELSNALDFIRDLHAEAAHPVEPAANVADVIEAHIAFLESRPAPGREEIAASDLREEITRAALRALEPRRGGHTISEIVNKTVSAALAHFPAETDERA